jgi:hypothetical protein
LACGLLRCYPQYNGELQYRALMHGLKRITQT